MNQSELIDAYERLFAEKGWKELIGDLNEKREHIKDVIADSKTGFDEVQFNRGRLDAFRYITGLESLVEHIKVQNSLPQVTDGTF